MGLYSGEVAIKNGDTYTKRDVGTARLWYSMALDDKDTRLIALVKLIELERSQGNFSKSREYIDLLETYDDLKIYGIVGKLEKDEHNYIKALEYFSKTLSDTMVQNQNLLNIANIYIQLGEFEIARRIYETIMNSFNNQSIFGIMNIDILEGDYKHGLEISKKFNLNNQPENDLYNIYYINLMYYSGLINEISDDLKSLYTYKILLGAYEEKVLMEHIKRHEKGDKIKENHFKKGIINSGFIYDVEHQVKSLVPTYTHSAFEYCLILPNNVGESIYGNLNAVRVITTLENKILTMYPIDLSSEFDREGMIHSEELKKKRLLGVRK